MKFLEAATHINASAETVYGVLTDFASYGEWCGMFKSMKGTAQAGQTFAATVEDKTGKVSTVSAKITVAQAPNRLVWAGGLSLPGMFTAEHSFDISPAEGGGTAFSHREEFRGLLTMMLTKKALSEAETQFNAFCTDIKARAEELAP